MIAEKDLQEAIAECEGQRNPNANTCIKLAAFYIIKDYLYGQRPESYSMAAEPPGIKESKYKSDTEFWNVAQDLDQEDLMPIIDELMSTLSIVQPRLYAGVMRKVKSHA